MFHMPYRYVSGYDFEEFLGDWVNYHFRMERISLTAAIPLLAIKTLVMTV